jgi:serine/threonine protein kinase
MSDDLPVLCNYVPEQKVGHGARGKVYRCHRKVLAVPPPAEEGSRSDPESQPATETVAVKVLSNINGNPAVKTPLFWREISMLYAAQPVEQVIPLLDLELYQRDEQLNLHIVMPYIEYDLATLIETRRLNSEDQIRSIIAQLLLGLRGLHKASIIHRDLSSKNVLVAKSLQTYICDFAAAGYPDAEERDTPGFVTQWYRAPEVLLDCQYGTPVDVWAVGVMMVEMFLGRYLFRGRLGDVISQVDEIFKLLGSVPPEDWDSPSWLDSASANAKHHIKATPLTQGSGVAYLPFSIKPSSQALDLMQKLIQMNPTKRPTAEQALRHEWFAADEIARRYVENELEGNSNVPSDNPETKFSKEVPDIEKIKLLVQEFHTTSTS